MTNNKPLREQVAEAIEAAQDEVMDRIERGDIPDGNWTAIVADAAIQAVREGRDAVRGVRTICRVL